MDRGRPGVCQAFALVAKGGDNQFFQAAVTVSHGISQYKMAATHGLTNFKQLLLENLLIVSQGGTVDYQYIL